VPRTPWRFAAAWLVAAATIFVGLGSLPLMDPDEGRNTEVAREMKATGSTLVPLYNGMPYLDKPALYFDTVAASLAVLGDTETAARLPSALFGLLTLVITWAFCRRVYGDRTAAIAVVVIATAPLFIAFSRTVIFDIALTFFVCASLLAGFMALETNGRSGGRWWYSLSVAAAALATLVKGPVGFLLPLLGLLAYARLLKVPGGRRFFSPLNLLIFLVPVLAWFVALSVQRPDFPYYGLIKESLTRFTSSAEFRRGGPVYYYIPVIAAVFFPWSALLPEMLIRGWQKRRAASRPDAMLAIFAIAVVIFFSISKSKLPGYVLPAIVVLGVMVARVFGAAIADPSGVPAALIRRAAVLLALVCGGAGALVAANQLRLVPLQAVVHIRDVEFERAQVVLTPLMLWLLGIAVAAAVARATRRIPAMLAAFALPPFLLMAVAAGRLPAYADARSSRPLAQAVRLHNPAGAEVACYRCFPPGLAFYLGRTITVISQDGHEIPSNYIEFELRKPSPWPPQMVRLDDADAWITSRRDAVFVLARGTPAPPWIAAVAAANAAPLQQLTPGWWGALVSPAGGP
jgi:4-amino-4-deoxy-L-arabinose transferase-like glycosyltransferase